MEKSALNKRVKELRLRKGLSQEQLAEDAGLSLRTIQRIENGETLPHGDTLTRLAIALKVSPDDIIDWQIIEDRSVLMLLNLSQFGYVAFPILGILIPLAIWILKKDKVKQVDEIGKAIINFQISWVILLFLFYITISASLLFNLGFYPPVFLLIGIIAFYMYNAILIVINTLKIQRGNRVRYMPAFTFLH
ncbi:helix-turn-helix domain-containing protein [Rhodocytophaga rosea]|uniref:Helix-turn-helix domain-containing protein n=1 Tax=Rhodocytophaga rosea TaxID=2704465 RepID=A0A6C0GCE7_9BACT|nr:helix-turn-helix domain-containing protein [Rhodocytophaga rosea]QHT65493.1 helix-turn-helix domain-containing protein [Rhodocytophaga rosea]